MAVEFNEQGHDPGRDEMGVNVVEWRSTDGADGEPRAHLEGSGVRDEHSVSSVTSASGLGTYAQPDVNGGAHVRRPMSQKARLSLLLFIALLSATVLVGMLAPLRINYYAMGPGPAEPTENHVTVEGGTIEPGDLVFLTVSVREATLYDYVASTFNDAIDLEPIENFAPADVEQEDIDRQNQMLMEESEMTAAYVAFSELGYDVSYSGSGAAVMSVIDGSSAEGIIDERDIIVKVDDTPIEFAQDAVDTLSGHVPGDVVAVALTRSDDPTDPDSSDRTEISVEVTLGPYRYIDDETGEVHEDNTRGMLGVLVESAGITLEFPTDVDFAMSGIGGPSAGMMLTLEIMNQLTPDDMTGGRVIAGTGTIDPEGNVGAIGGMHQKTYGAIDSGAEVLLVPVLNYNEAVAAADGRIEVVAVTTLDDALKYLEES